MVRSRFERRAREHATGHLANGNPPMRASISYLTSTSATAAPLPTLHGAHRLDVLGYDRVGHSIYLREEVGAPLPLVHVVRTRGEHAGRMVTLRSWYEGDDGA